MFNALSAPKMIGRLIHKRLKSSLSRPTTVLVFPGQGVFSVEHLDFLSKRVHVEGVEELLEEADDALGFTISRFVRDPKANLGGYIESPIQKTSIQQPLLLLTTKLLAKVIREEHGVDMFNDPVVKPHYLLGHSLGEIIALVMQDVIDFRDGIKFCSQRGMLMEKCVASYYQVGDPQRVSEDQFKMFALVFPSQIFDHVLKFLRNQDQISLSNINNFQQIVISGLESSCLVVVSRLKEHLAELKLKARIRAIDLDVKVPFHNDILSPVKGGLDQMLQAYIGAPILGNKIGYKPGEMKFPVVSNLDGCIQTYAEDQIRNIIDVTSRPVNFLKCLQTIQELSEEVKYINFGSVTSGIISKFVSDKRSGVHAGSCTNIALDTEEGLKTIRKTIQNASQST
ncbi:unnamed protein product [Kuraishia capsulata CBS 1993]|uniref:[acyl-carrier-protein] S-malonyltransferase n=1 Tax=Kuraishia capsulata CBS 1993 TaxID=1382522 RepID=W6MXU2_9ASCO|nr:uncharacterized protein KUCA_T00005468001 [Kuraishia capsulata CBS 1993]CDK29480.1 unnamed protein product [Kuraishia capsulata CBS 1993]